MLENRSFDNLLGNFYDLGELPSGTSFEGLIGKECRIRSHPACRHRAGVTSRPGAWARGQSLTALFPREQAAFQDRIGQSVPNYGRSTTLLGPS
jgi:hypothetical protein